MVTVTIDEITLNAVRAALDERVKNLQTTIEHYQSVAAEEWGGPGWTKPEDADRALVWNIAALHETEMAREFFSEVSIEPEQADPITAAKAANDRDYHTWQAYSEGELIGGSR